MKSRVSWNMWWSGLFGMLAVGHAVRVATGAVVMAGQTMVPMWISQIVAPIAAVLSVLLLGRAYRTARCRHAPPGQRLDSLQQQAEDLESLSCRRGGNRHDAVDEATD